MIFKKIGVTVFMLIGNILFIFGQTSPKTSYTIERYKSSIDSLRKRYQNRIVPKNDTLALASYLALGHYPSLQNHKIKIRYKKKVKYPITASWSFWNIFKLRKNHTYILLIKPGSFVERLNLNQQVGVIGHEMAHFAYYRRRPSIAMAWWGLRYTLSNKFRYQFEKDADRSAINQGLGWQLLDISFYLNSLEVKNHMEKLEIYGL